MPFKVKKEKTMTGPSKHMAPSIGVAPLGYMNIKILGYKRDYIIRVYLEKETNSTSVIVRIVS